MHACSPKCLQREAGLNIAVAMIAWHSPPDKSKSALHHPRRNLHLIAYVCHINEAAKVSCLFALEVNETEFTCKDGEDLIQVAWLGGETCIFYCNYTCLNQKVNALSSIPSSIINNRVLFITINQLREILLSDGKWTITNMNAVSLWMVSAFVHRFQLFWNKRWHVKLPLRLHRVN